ncbi:MAG: glycerophosphoryl diester phosphodiesterase [Actinomycetota bacterium]|jgi:glycerophosphoryl diester phosphodiesterase|nr:glycerophosphoryl diester phosphodiesterase [Actinomycetota bacterium]MEA2972610.1 glycerophosphoryl diester phosphodiesterase [Actinomycetota bacterium]
MPESLRPSPIAFAHRGGRAHAPENTMEAFKLGLRLGATGLESDAWLTADGVPVLDHDGLVRARRLGRLRSVPIAAVPRAGLPDHVPTLAELYAECGSDFELSLDAKDHAAAEAVVAAARAAGNGAHERLWICHPDWELLARWRKDPDFDGVRLVNSTRLKEMRQGAERRAAQLAEAGIDAVNLHYSDWSGGKTVLFHRFGRYAFGWDAQHERIIRDLVRMGIDGIFSDHVDRLVDAMGLVR